MRTSAKVITDSISMAGVRLTTMEVVMHRFVLAEFNTHRIFSRNSASSRAIPLHKQLERVRHDPAIPVAWPLEQPGMQGSKEEANAEQAELIWLHARSAAVHWAQQLGNLGVHKSVANRILEPYMWHAVIVTATDFDGFWDQRCSELAQPEIRVAAEAMREVYEASTPAELHRDEWHLPYIHPDEKYMSGMDKKKLSVARCARVSYLTHDGRRDHAADFKLYDRLVQADPMHASPLEHVALQCDPRPHEHLGNFRGWDQLRHLLGAG